MSFKGYHQVICENQHLFRVPTSYESESDQAFGVRATCPHCRARPIWTNIVDDTNCEAAGRVEVDVETVTLELMDKGVKLYFSFDKVKKMPSLNVGYWWSEKKKKWFTGPNTLVAW